MVFQGVGAGCQVVLFFVFHDLRSTKQMNLKLACFSAIMCNFVVLVIYMFFL